MPPSTGEQFDFVIVGGGTAGCILANRLTESGRHRVLVLEAGGKPASMWIRIPAGFTKLLTNPQYNWNFKTVAEPGTKNREIAVPRGKGLGGSSLINGMIFVRGQREDYDAWQTAGASAWGFKDVEPYFRKLENYQPGGVSRGKDGPLYVDVVRERFPLSDAFLHAAAEAGHAFNDDYNSWNQEGFGYYQVTQRNGRRWSAYDAYLQPALRWPNLEVRTQAHVLGLILEGTRCRGVRYLRDGREVTVTASREVILAAGAIQTPQVLELSGIGDPALLQSVGIPVRHTLAGVGKNYLDHFCTRMNWRIRNAVTLNELTRGRRLAGELLKYAIRKRGVLTLGTGLVHGFVKTRPELPACDAQYFVMHASYANAAVRVLDQVPGMTIGVTQLRPESVGSIHVRSPHFSEAPVIAPNFLASEVDRGCLVDSMKLARALMAQPAMQPYVAHETSPGPGVVGDDEWLDFARSNGQTIYHPIGTCRMGSDPGSVVDPQLRVRGLDGLRVVDASVMPKMISGNIQAAVMMVAEKASDLILQDHRR